MDGEYENEYFLLLSEAFFSSNVPVASHTAKKSKMSIPLFPFLGGCGGWIFGDFRVVRDVSTQKTCLQESVCSGL